MSTAQTEFGKGAEEYKELFDNVKTALSSAIDVDTVKLNGSDRQQFGSMDTRPCSCNEGDEIPCTRDLLLLAILHGNTN